MAERLLTMSDEDLGRALADVGARLAVPSLPDLAPSVASAIAAEPVREAERERSPVDWARERLRPRRRATPRRAMALAVAFLVVLAGAAVASGIAVRGIRLIVRDDPIPSTVAPIGSRLGLGEVVTLAEARANVGFDAVLPAGLGPPEEVWLSDVADGGLLTFVYAPREGLTELGRSGVGLLLTQFVGRTDVASIEKEIRGGTNVVVVEVNGEPGYWISGPPHSVRFIGRDGNDVPPGPRLAADTLIWQRGELTLRLESALPLVEALAVAEGVS